MIYCVHVLTAGNHPWRRMAIGDIIGLVCIVIFIMFLIWMIFDAQKGAEDGSSDKISGITQQKGDDDKGLNHDSDSV